MKINLRFDRRFRFANDKLNERLISLLAKKGIPFAVDDKRFVYYHSADEENLEGVLARIRSAVFPSWQILSSPKDWTERYRDEMDRRGIEYQEELTDGSVDFLIAQGHKPHSWKMA